MRDAALDFGLRDLDRSVLPARARFNVMATSLPLPGMRVATGPGLSTASTRSRFAFGRSRKAIPSSRAF